MKTENEVKEMLAVCRIAKIKLQNAGHSEAARIFDVMISVIKLVLNQASEDMVKEYECTKSYIDPFELRVSIELGEQLCKIKKILLKKP